MDHECFVAGDTESEMADDSDSMASIATLLQPSTSHQQDTVNVELPLSVDREEKPLELKDRRLSRLSRQSAPQQLVTLQHDTISAIQQLVSVQSELLQVERQRLVIETERLAIEKERLALDKSRTANFLMPAGADGWSYAVIPEV
jgi:hypothetical protein